MNESPPKLISMNPSRKILLCWRSWFFLSGVLCCYLLLWPKLPHFLCCKTPEMYCPNPPLVHLPFGQSSTHFLQVAFAKNPPECTVLTLFYCIFPSGQDAPLPPSCLCWKNLPKMQCPAPPLLHLQLVILEFLPQPNYVALHLPYKPACTTLTWFFYAFMTGIFSTTILWIGVIQALCW